MIDEAHRQLRDLLGAHVLGQLESEEQEAVRDHLRWCPDCQDELAEIEPLVPVLRLVDADRIGEFHHVPPPGLDRAILNAIHDERPSHRGRIARSALVAAAAAILGAGVGYAVAPKPPELPLEPVALTVSAPLVESTADVVSHSWGMEIKLTGNGFDSGVAYQVFVRTRDGREVNAGEFVGTGAASLRCNLNSSVLRDDAVGFRVVDEHGREVLTSSLI